MEKMKWTLQELEDFWATKGEGEGYRVWIERGCCNTHIGASLMGLALDGEVDAVHLMVRHLSSDDRDRYVRLMAVTSLYLLDWRAALPHLRLRLGKKNGRLIEQDPETRIVIITIVGKWGTEEEAARARNLLSSKDPHQKFLAQEAKSKLDALELKPSKQGKPSGD